MGLSMISGLRSAWFMTTQRSGDIVGKLQQKGISRDDIQRILQENPVDEEAQARAVFEKRCRAMKALDVDKLYRYMVGKGFSYDIVRRLLREQNSEAAPQESIE